MKRIILLFLLFAPTFVHACDICNFYIGLSPNDYRNSFGIIYRSRFLYGEFNAQGLQTRHASSVPVDELKKGKELFNVAELRFRYYIGKKKKWDLIGAVPLLNNYRSINGYTQYDVFGAGDPIVLVNHQLFSSKKEKKYLHRLSVGAGIKLPFGMKHLSYHRAEADLDLQGSTGSVDFITRAEYSGLYKNFGWNHQLSYRLNTVGTDEHHYGNTTNYSVLLFYRKQLAPRRIFAPGAGLIFEHAQQDKDHGALLNDSGGNVLLLSTGFDFFAGSTQFQFSYQPALKNNFEGKQFPVVNRFVGGVTISL